MTNEDQIIELLTEIRDNHRLLLEEHRDAKIKALDRAQELKQSIEEQRKITNQQKADSVADAVERLRNSYRMDRSVAIALLVLAAVSALGTVVLVLTHV
jgi:hypothetical protein